jgi:hypothetical protein
MAAGVPQGAWEVSDIKGRAATPKVRRAVMDRILAAWVCQPSQRLGQFLDNAASRAGRQSVFYIEDDALADAAEAFAREAKP